MSCSTNNRRLIAGYLSVFNYFRPTELNCSKLNVTSFRVGITFEVKKGLELLCPIFSTWFTHENVFFHFLSVAHILPGLFFFFLNVIHFLSKVNNSARSTNLWWTHRRTRVSFLARPEKSFLIENSVANFYILVIFSCRKYNANIAIWLLRNPLSEVLEGVCVFNDDPIFIKPNNWRNLSQVLFPRAQIPAVAIDLEVVRAPGWVCFVTIVKIRVSGNRLSPATEA